MTEEHEPLLRRGRENSRGQLPHRRPRQESEGSREQLRQLSVCVYNLAAEMERRIDRTRCQWVVSPEVFNAKIVSN